MSRTYHQTDSYCPLQGRSRCPILGGFRCSPRRTSRCSPSADSKIINFLSINNLHSQKSANPTVRKYGTPESPSTRNCGEEAYQGRRAHELKNTQYQQVIITARAELSPNIFQGFHSSFRPSHTFDKTSSICLEHFE